MMGYMIKTIQSKRRTCAIKECDKPTRNKGFRNGKRIWGHVCSSHHQFRYVLNGWGINGFPKKIPNDKCEQCGWDKSFCDRHRINPKLGYTRKNVKVLCPNCHRLATFP